MHMKRIHWFIFGRGVARFRSVVQVKESKHMASQGPALALPWAVPETVLTCDWPVLVIGRWSDSPSKVWVISC